MTENSSIEWTTHTLNPWIGCTKVSPGCANCYAEALMDKRYGKVKWGPNETRVRTSTANWKLPLKWNRDAQASAERPRVFCASLADVFEDREELDHWRCDLWELIEATPNLDWLLLTKRPENVTRMVFNSWRANWPENVWMGTSAESQEEFDKRAPHLCRINAPVKFISAEPLIGPLKMHHEYDGQYVRNWLGGTGINWVIVGGESGAGSRWCNVQWVRKIRNQCKAAGIACFIKQLGSKPYCCVGGHDSAAATYGADVDCHGGGGFGCEILRLSSKGGDPSEWPADLRVREFPSTAEPSEQ